MKIFCFLLIQIIMITSVNISDSFCAKYTNLATSSQIRGNVMNFNKIHDVIKDEALEPVSDLENKSTFEMHEEKSKKQDNRLIQNYRKIVMFIIVIGIGVGIYFLVSFIFLGSIITVLAVELFFIIIVVSVVSLNYPKKENFIPAQELPVLVVSSSSLESKKEDSKKEDSKELIFVPSIQEFNSSSIFVELPQPPVFIYPKDEYYEPANLGTFVSASQIISPISYAYAQLPVESKSPVVSYVSYVFSGINGNGDFKLCALLSELFEDFLIYFVAQALLMVLWILAAAVFDITLLNDKVLMFFFINLGLGGLIVKRYQEYETEY